MGTLTGMILGDLLFSYSNSSTVQGVTNSVRNSEYARAYLAAYLSQNGSPFTKNEELMSGLSIAAPKLGLIKPYSNTLTHLAIPVVANHRHIDKVQADVRFQAQLSKDSAIAIFCSEILTDILFHGDIQRINKYEEKLDAAQIEHRNTDLEEPLDSVLHAAWIVNSSDTFESCLCTAMAEAEISPLFGTVVGQIAGAIHGLGRIPMRWLEMIPNRKQYLLDIHALYDQGKR